MANWWENIQIKKGPGGCGDVTEEQKNNLIDQAVSTWEGMGLSDEQIAFGIGVMGLESGVQSSRKGHDVKLGRVRPRSVHQENVGRRRSLLQQQARAQGAPGAGHRSCQGQGRPRRSDRRHGPMGPQNLGKSRTIPGRQRPSGYGFEEIAYGKWHGGQNETPELIGQFLGDPRYNNADMRGYFTTNVDRARQALAMRKPAT